MATQSNKRAHTHKPPSNQIESNRHVAVAHKIFASFSALKYAINEHWAYHGIVYLFDVLEANRLIEISLKCGLDCLLPAANINKNDFNATSIRSIGFLSIKSKFCGFVKSFRFCIRKKNANWDKSMSNEFIWSVLNKISKFWTEKWCQIWIWPKRASIVANMLSSGQSSSIVFSRKSFNKIIELLKWPKQIACCTN